MKLCGIVLLVIAVWMAPAETQAAGLRELTDADRASWQAIGPEILLTPDGQYLVYRQFPTGSARYVGTKVGGGAEYSGNTTVVVVRTMGTAAETRYPAGPLGNGGAPLQMSKSGRWVAFSVKPPVATGALAVESPTTLQILELPTGQTQNIEGVRYFTLSGGQATWLALELQPSADTAPETIEFDVVLRPMGADHPTHLKGVTEYAFNANGTYFAWATTHGVFVQDLASGKVTAVDTTTISTLYRNLTWSGSGRSLAILRSEPGVEKQASMPTVGSEPVRYSLLVRRDLISATAKTDAFNSLQWQGFPGDREICTDSVSSIAKLLWRDDEEGVFFCTCARPASVRDLGLPKNLAVWHWKGAELPGEKKNAGVSSFLSFVGIKDRRYVPLADPALPNVEPSTRGRYVLAYDWKVYGWQNDPVDSRSPQLRNYFLVELATGKRTSLVEGLAGVPDRPDLFAPPTLSPDGAFAIYQRDGNYFAYELATAQTRNLTEHLPTRFFYEANDPRSGYAFKRAEFNRPILQGWTVDNDNVLLSDSYDIWVLPLKGGPGRNLTENGRREHIAYDLTRSVEPMGTPQEPRVHAVNLRRPIYLRALQVDTRRQGLARLTPGQPMKVLRWDDADIEFFQATSAPTRLYRRETATEPMNYYLADEAWAKVRQLTDVDPVQKRIQWFPPPRFLGYTTPRGDSLHAVLYLPFGYESGHAYPTVVIVYEQLSDLLHYYRDPNFNADTFAWLQNGYALLLTDILPRAGEPGPAALEAVQSAVAAAVETGSVDRDRLGLWGHSYGAYETSFIVSQTDQFKAAAVYAGYENLWTGYGDLYGNGTPSSLSAERGQGAIGGPWWQHWNAYLSNSPLYHAANIHTPILLGHGDQDRQVPLAQSLELFNTLRRMGDKPVVLLEYKGQDHVFEGESATDFDVRTHEFFDHFLKDAPAPAWWSDGVSYYPGEMSAPQPASQTSSQ